MADEVRVEDVPGTAYFLVANAAQQRWNGAAFENHDDSHWTNYDVALVQQGTSGTQVGTFPAGIGGGVYTVTAYRRAGGTPAIDDEKIGSVEADWSGTAFRTLTLVLAKLNAAVVRVTSPVLDDGTLAIVQGDDYLEADGRALVWTVPDWSGPDVDELDVELRLITRAQYDAGEGSGQAIAGSVAMAGDDAVFKVDLSAAQSVALEGVPPANKYNYVYQLVSVDEANHELTQAIGSATVTRRVTA